MLFYAEFYSQSNLVGKINMFSEIQHQLHKFVQRGLDNHLRLAVTGLSRSGKTAFITSLVDQLLYINTQLESNGEKSHLNLFMPARNGQILSVKRGNQENLSIPRFEYDKNRAGFEREVPVWSESTRGISEIRLIIKYQRRNSLLRHLKETATLYLDIFDYPGEWLLDLPLLSQSFKEWSQAQQAVHKGKRKELAEQSWLPEVEKLDLSAKADENLLAELSEQYTQYLFECKAVGMQYIQPGRFVLPHTDQQGAPVYQFFPLLNLSDEMWEQLENSPKGSVFHTLKARYQFYKKSIVKPFYEDYFSQFDRQVILADCLTPLNHSQEAFIEMQIGLRQLFKHFHYGERSFFNRLFSAHIDKLLFVATKADHITASEIPNLESLLRQLVQEGGNYDAFDGITVGYQAIASVRATNYIQVEEDGELKQGIMGIRTSSKMDIKMFPGSVPATLPNSDFWHDESRQKYDFEQFEPKRIRFDQNIPHLRMDSVLQFLLADKFD